jgi:hypothetical protein
MIAAGIMQGVWCTGVAAQSGPGVVTGVVLNVTGRPLAGAGVALNPDGSTRVMRTDRDGRFRFTGVATGEHILRVSWIGYKPRDQVLEVPAAGLEVEIKLEPIARRLDTLKILARVSGILGSVASRQSRLPLSGASIEAMGTRFRTATSHDGKFSVPAAEEGSYVLALRHHGFRTRLMSVAVPPEGAVEVEALLDSIVSRSDAMFEGRLRDMEWRVHRRTPNTSAVIGLHELAALEENPLDAALQFAPSLYSRGLIARGPVCALFVNGREERFMTLRDFTPADVEMVEIYGNVRCRESERGPRGYAVRRTGPPGMTVYLWLKR